MAQAHARMKAGICQNGTDARWELAGTLVMEESLLESLR
jgi:hypothetical protein